jgi:hypothetical protein
MKDLYNKILASLDNHSKGFSARKLSALVVITLVVVAHVKWIYAADFSLLTEVLMLDYGFISVCLGMTTYEAIKKTKQDGASEQ